MSDAVLLACGDRAMGLHASDHDGLKNPHPSCVACSGIRPGACTPVPPPDLDGRFAMCDYHGSERYKSGPIYGGDDCSAPECFCVVPSSLSLPFFSINDGPIGPSEFHKPQRCAVAGVPSTAAFDSRGQCVFFAWMHDERQISVMAREIRVKYKAECRMCRGHLRIGGQALWWKDGPTSLLAHLRADCPARQHEYVARAVIAQDTFYCGCHGWD